jgi:UDP-3-O-[3-hydroxymyristoyl] N-acetylglucosamine deacetylase
MTPWQSITSPFLEWASSLPKEPQYQQTLLDPTDWIKGIEPYSGKEIGIKIFPAPPNTGLIFSLTKISPPDTNKSIITSIENGAAKDRAICLESNGFRIASVEHLLATLYAFNVDNAFIMVDKKIRRLFRREKVGLPLFPDGVLSIIYQLKKAHIVEQKGFYRPYKTVTEKLEATHPDKGDYIAIEPGNSFSIDYTAGYPHLDIAEQSRSFQLTPESFLTELAEARTLIHSLNHLPPLLARFLAKFSFLSYGYGIGINQENAICPFQGKFYNEPRYLDSQGGSSELVRHKIQDLLGEISILGLLKKVKIKAIKTGHQHNLEFMKKLSLKLKPI